MRSSMSMLQMSLAARSRDRDVNRKIDIIMRFGVWCLFHLTWTVPSRRIGMSGYQP